LNQWNLNIYIHPKFAAAQHKTAEFELPTPSFFVMNGGISFSRKNIQFVSSVNNIFNTPYFNNLSMFRPIGIYEPARNVVIKLLIGLDRKI
jgi:outer membrane receptor protein involved in Fe transport